MNIDVDANLKHWTGKGRVEWVSFIQEAITRNSTPTSDKNHDHTNTMAWLIELNVAVAKAIEQRLEQGIYAEGVNGGKPITTKDVDENIATARVVSIILAMWAARVSRAKAYDPRRPAAKRREAMGRLLAYQSLLLQAVSDESLDHEHFPGQAWDPPFPPTATDGDFV